MSQQLYGRSLHIGVNAGDPVHYGAKAPTLQGCENDAWFMAEVARHHRFSDIRVLLGRQATADAVLDEIRLAAAELPEDSFFLLTFAGHGGQVPNLEDQEPELNDQAWCLYDRELIDDELRLKCWPTFRAGVRVLVLIDACHSGSSIWGLSRALRPFVDNHRRSRTECVPAMRELPGVVNLLTVLRNWHEYSRIRRALGKKKKSPLACTVLSIAACLDNERTPDGLPHGGFTECLRKVWDEGRFVGSHSDLFDALMTEVRGANGNSPQMCCAESIDPAFLAASAFTI